ncbi:twin-arginine translocation signal domain-containing protein, partial [Streptomyces violascens]|uniref:twin-arginine translocation signal domain-containing protein n=1 Tax=Streptomyces violascens TaxID=67381 RepID=UPI00364C4853
MPGPCAPVRRQLRHRPSPFTCCSSSIPPPLVGMSAPAVSLRTISGTQEAAVTHPSRRTVLRSTAAAGALATVPASALLWSQPAVAGTPGPEQVHLQYGNEP